MYIEDWRPIFLLKGDVKIASKSLTLRLEKLLPQIINVDQYADLMVFIQLTTSSRINYLRSTNVQAHGCFQFQFQ